MKKKCACKRFSWEHFLVRLLLTKAGQQWYYARKWQRAEAKIVAQLSKEMADQIDAEVIAELTGKPIVPKTRTIPL